MKEVITLANSSSRLQMIKSQGVLVVFVELAEIVIQLAQIIVDDPLLTGIATTVRRLGPFMRSEGRWLLTPGKSGARR